MPYVLLCAWGACLFGSFVGWGRLLSRSAAWPMAGAVGAALLTAIGGVLSIAHLVTRPVLLSVVLAGNALLVALTPWRRPAFPRPSVSLGLLLLFVGIEVFGNVRPDVRSFHHNDDLQAYLTFPAETLQLGTLPADPFNERRVTSSLGAPYVLQGLVLSIGADVRSIRMMDVSVGVLLYAGLLWTVARQAEFSGQGALAFTLGLFAVPIFRMNATMVILPAALFCGLFLLLRENGLANTLQPRRAFFLALIAAALTAWKSNYLPAALLLCGLFYAASFIVRRRPAALMEGLLFSSVFVLLLLPWMLEMKAKEATYLFPLLGRGYDASAYRILPMPNGSHSLSSGALWVWLTVLPMAGPLVVGAVMCWQVHRRNREEEGSLILGTYLLGSAIAIAGIASSTGGESIGRYSLPFQVPALLIFGAFAWHWRSAWAVGLAAASLLFLALLFGIRHGQYRTYAEDARLLTPPAENWFDMQTEERRDRALQIAVPKGEPLFVRLRVTYPLNFNRNTIYVGDYLGMAGLPPGMPVNQGREALRQYFLACGIRYVAFDPGRTWLADDDPQTTIQQFLQNPARYGRHGWLYMQFKVSNAERDTLASLGQVCSHVYDDGVVYVMDLNSVQAPAPTQVR